MSNCITDKTLIFFFVYTDAQLYVGLTFHWNVLRDCDMLTLGAFTPDEVHEDVEISFAALEHRFPNLEKRASPVQNQAAFG